MSGARNQCLHFPACTSTKEKTVQNERRSKPSGTSTSHGSHLDIAVENLHSVHRRDLIFPCWKSFMFCALNFRRPNFFAQPLQVYILTSFSMQPFSMQDLHRSSFLGSFMRFFISSDSNSLSIWNTMGAARPGDIYQHNYTDPNLAAKVPPLA